MDSLNTLECVKFNLSGNTGFLKNPSHNLKDTHRTYSHIHYVGIKGFVGAMLGLKGFVYNKQFEDDEELPQFYRELRDLKIAIVPSEYQFKTKFITFNNTTGFANGRGSTGSTQNITEQWLINPSWDIYIMSNHKYYDEIKERLLENNFVYDLYIGRRGHGAFIENIEVINLTEIKEDCYVDSLFLEDEFEIINSYQTKDDTGLKLFPNILPLKIDENLKNRYDMRVFNLSNCLMKNQSRNKVYKFNDKNIVFY